MKNNGISIPNNAKSSSINSNTLKTQDNFNAAKRFHLGKLFDHLCCQEVNETDLVDDSIKME